MHISDGLLSPPVCAATGLVAAGAVGWSLHRLNDSLTDRTVPLTGMMASLVFAGQMVNFPLFGVGVSGHLLGGVLAAVVLGPWAGCIAISLVLVVQMALFNDGGWTVLGANVLNMAVIGSLGGYAVYSAVRRVCGEGVRGIVLGAVIAAWLSVLAGAALFCVEFRLSYPSGAYDFSHVFFLMTLFHSGIGVGEALITGLIVSFVATHRPDLLYRAQVAPTVMRGVGRTVAAGVVCALAVAAFLAPFASQYEDGLNAVAQRHFSELEQPAQPLLLEEYSIPLAGEDWKLVSVSLAGIGGTLTVLAVALLLGFSLKAGLRRREADHGA
jgi:cobalt/nickel transport system permease protein